MSDSTIFEQQNKLFIAEFSAKPLTLDYLMRWGSLGLYRFLSTPNSNDFLWLFFILQAVISLFTLGFVLWRDFQYRVHVEGKTFSSDKSQMDYFLKGFNLEKPYELMSSSLSVILRVFYALTFCYMVTSAVYNIEEIDFSTDTVTGRGFGMLFAGTLCVYGLFVMFISVLSVTKIPEEARKITQKPKKKKEDRDLSKTDKNRPALQKSLAPEEYEEVDLNDIALVELEGDEKNLVNRVDAYVLESVMFGALTFSGFLTLIAIDPETFDIAQIRLFGHGLISFLRDLVVFEFSAAESYGIFVSAPKPPLPFMEMDSSTIHLVNEIAIDWNDEMKMQIQEAVQGTQQLIAELHTSTHFTHAQNLLIWLMLETLISSSFFLLVIASRLRFTQLIEKIDNAINLAKTYNTKEEEVYMLHLQFEKNRTYRKRLESLSARIEKQVRVAQELLLEVRPVVAYMSLFRNLGVLMFLVIIITSLIFFDFRIALFFGFLCLMVYAYKQFDDWYRQRRLRSIIEKHQEENKKKSENSRQNS